MTEDHEAWEAGASKGEPCWGGIEQASPDHSRCKVLHAHGMVHIDRKIAHGSFPPPRHMEGLRWQREPSSSGKHLKEDGIEKVADEGPGGSNTGFIRPLPGRRITLLWLCTFCFMDYKGKKPRGSRTGACLNGPLALIEQDPGTAAIRVKRSHTLIVSSRAGSMWPRAFWQFEGCCGKSEAMPAADSFNGCRTLQQVSHSGVTTLRMRGSKGHFKQEKGTSREAHVAVRLAALGRLPQRVEVGKRGNRRPEGDAIVAKATDLCRQRNACQRVLMGIDLGYGVHDAGRAISFSTCLARRLQHWGSRVAVERSRGCSLQESLHDAADQQSLFGLLHCSSDGTTHILHQDFACSGKC